MTGRFLNVGCGSRYHPEWVNVDLVPLGPEVIGHDLRTPLPFESESFDVVYHSHVIEHLALRDAETLLRECGRVLRTGGIVRVATPDLATIASLYLESFHAAAAGQADREPDHRWMTIELLDQLVREEPGGAMIAHLRSGALPNNDFVLARVGSYGMGIMDATSSESTHRSFISRLRHVTPRTALRRARHTLKGAVLDRGERAALRSGLFRESGEVHKWLYDEHSLAALLRATGFSDPVRQEAGTSLVSGWKRFHLDVDTDGTVYKPDSFYMEAVRHSSDFHGPLTACEGSG